MGERGARRHVVEEFEVRTTSLRQKQAREVVRTHKHEGSEEPRLLLMPSELRNKSSSTLGTFTHIAVQIGNSRR
jgi:hypothetical protein